MLTLQEIIDFSECDADDIETIAEIEHVPDIVAAELAYQLIRTPRGVYALHNRFLDAIAQAEADGNRERVRRIERSYRSFAIRFPKPRVL